MPRALQGGAVSEEIELCVAYFPGGYNVPDLAAARDIPMSDKRVPH
jgi:hypothetical protein